MRRIRFPETASSRPQFRVSVNGFHAQTLEHFEALDPGGSRYALAYKYSPASSRPHSFAGASEAKLIALARSQPPARRARRTLQLLEEKVVELSIVDRHDRHRVPRARSIRIKTRNHLQLSGRQVTLAAAGR